MKHLITAVLLAAVLLGGCSKTQPAGSGTSSTARPSKESLEKLAELAKVALIHKSMLASFNQSVDESFTKVLRGAPPTPQDKAVLADIHAQISALLEPEMGGKQLEEMFEQVYAQTYTQGQVDSLIAFYGTPIGQVFAEKQPEVSNQVLGMVQKRYGQIAMKMQMAVYGGMRKVATAHAPKPVTPPPVAIMAAKPKPGAPKPSPLPPSGQKWGITNPLVGGAVAAPVPAPARQGTAPAQPAALAPAATTAPAPGPRTN
jgi:hypothetical protein